jgi:nitroimidazol reductase NimA-like FMN-containing flavoprotein (pyridoxamine 5'-phosphate oxidase superfamily)
MLNCSSGNREFKTNNRIECLISVCLMPPVLSSAEIDELLSKTLIANLATLDNDGGIHLLPIWFLRINNDICIPTSHHTHKYRNLRARPRASVMIDISKDDE